MTTPLSREEIDSLTGKTEPVQLTREEFAAMPVADRMRAYRAGQISQIFADVQDAAQKRQDAARDLYLKQHPEHAHLFKGKNR